MQRRIKMLSRTWCLAVSLFSIYLVYTKSLDKPNALSYAQQEKVESFDIVIYGGTSGGIVAAVAAAREKRNVVILEPSGHLGGMTTGGLGNTDVGNPGAIGGYSREFYQRVFDYYVRHYGKDSPQVRDCRTGFRFEPHVASRIFRDLIEECGIKVYTHEPLRAIRKEGNRISEIRTGKGKIWRAQIYIDATYEGDLLAQAGVSYVVGREGRKDFGESLAGVQEFSKAHQWYVKVSPFDAQGRLLPLVQPGPLDPPGTGDKKVQAYNFRLCLTQRDDLRVPWPKPQNYDPGRYELLARYLKARPDVKFSELCNPVPIPNGKTDTNNNGPISTDHIGANWDYPEGNAEVRQRIWQDHKDYIQGFFYFLAHDERVPAKLQAEVRSWGLAKDEFTDTNNWPPQLYVREARRMRGVYVMTQHDIEKDRWKSDAVGLGSYNMDSHHVQRVPTPDGGVINEGDFQVRVQPYSIPYRSILPKPEECSNLLVPVCVSATHVAYGSIRMEPVFMVLGQASGIAAHLALEHRCSVQEIPVEKLTQKLREQKAVLNPDEVPAKTPAKKLPAKEE
ncbi:MAG: FAD-dependent oxidoreductase [Gemmatales bacterium]|nr:FAD-dependent oxidoreductase [Gemmatales bacterium]MDW7993516.1 FAD-dependent oxidoreductase [Gemmatales bacterium]